jgi:hypothetical protein
MNKKVIKDTIQFVDELKLLYPKKNSYKSLLNSISDTIGRIKKMNYVYQWLAPLNTGVTKWNSDDRVENTDSVNDNNGIISFNLDNIKTILKSTSDVHQKAVLMYEHRAG